MEEKKPLPNPIRALGELFHWFFGWIGRNPKQAFWAMGVILPVLGTATTSLATLKFSGDGAADSLVIAKLDQLADGVQTVAGNQVVLAQNQNTTAEILSLLPEFRKAEDRVRRLRQKRVQDSIRRRELYGPPLWENPALEAMPFDHTASNP